MANRARFDLFRLLRRLRRQVRVEAPWFDGLLLELVIPSDLSRCIWVTGCFEPNEMAFVRSLLRPGMTFVDVGANVGLYSMLAARLVGPGGVVVALEPSPRERAQLEAHLARNRLGNVRVRREAATDHTGLARLQLADAYWGGQNTLGEPVHEGVSVVESVEVPATTLDDIVRSERLDHVDCVKIDVEGAEAAVLRGAAETLERHRPVLLVELLDPSLRRQGSSAAEVARLITGHGYELCRFAPASGLPEPVVPGADLGANVVALPAG